jgi:transposase
VPISTPPGQKSSPDAEALGRSQGGFSTKRHVRSDGNGKPMTFILTPGQRHERTVAEQLVKQGAVRQPRRGRPRCRPQRIAADKGYSSRKFRTFLRRRGIWVPFPTSAMSIGLARLTEPGIAYDTALHASAIA